MRPPLAALLLLLPLSVSAAHAETAAEVAQRQIDRELARGDDRPSRGPATAGSAGASARVDALDSDRVPLLTLRGLQDDGAAGTSSPLSPAPAPMLGGNLPP